MEITITATSFAPISRCDAELHPAGQDLRRVAQELAPLVGDAKPARMALEQLHPKIAFQLLVASVTGDCEMERSCAARATPPCSATARKYCR